MCCAITILGLLGPRVLLIISWLTNQKYFNQVFDSNIAPIIGFFLMPWTTVAYLWVGLNGVNGIEWLAIVIGIIADISSYSGSAYGNKDKWKH